MNKRKRSKRANQSFNSSFSLFLVIAAVVSTYYQYLYNNTIYWVKLKVSKLTIYSLCINTHETNGISPNLDYNIQRKEVDYGRWKRVYVTLPPFYWDIPNGLNKTWRDWFWIQDENYRHFNDTQKLVTGVVRIIKNGSFSGSFEKLSNQTHYINMRGNPTFTNKTDDDKVMYITGHEIQYFQHFFDNGIPQIMLMLFASQLKPSDVTIRLSGCNSHTITNTLKMSGFKNIIISSRSFTASTLILPEIVPVIHPLYHRNFRKYLNLNFTDFNKIIFISRTQTDGCKNQRIIQNQDKLCDAMFKKYGDNFVLFKAKNNNNENTVGLFSKAAAIIGAHGGAMYNQMFSPTNASIIEIMPIGEDGLYVGQASRNSMPPFAHLAIHTNAVMLGQKFYRYYQPTSLSAGNMVIDPGDFLKWFSHIIK